MKPTLGHYIILDENVLFGSNVKIGNYVHIRPDVEIGNDCDIRDYCYLAQGCKIGNHVKIFQFSNIASGSIVEDDVYIGPKVLMANTKKISHGRSYKPCLIPPIIGRGARIGSGAIILPGVTIGEQSLIGAGSVVTKNTMPFGVYVGNPAKYIKPISERERL